MRRLFVAVASALARKRKRRGRRWDLPGGELCGELGAADVQGRALQERLRLRSYVRAAEEVFLTRVKKPLVPSGKDECLTVWLSLLEHTPSSVCGGEHREQRVGFEPTFLVCV
jgi:hypothetical protein